MSNITNLGEWINVCSLGDIEMGSMFPFEANGKWVVIYHVENGLFATDNVCSHAFALLSDGWLEDDTVECPLHGALFNVRTGAVERGPASCAVKSYPVQVIDTAVMCLIPLAEESDNIPLTTLS